MGVSLLSAFAGAFVTAKVWERQLETWNLIAAQGQVYVAREIYHGHGTQVADKIRESVPTYVRQVDPDQPGYPHLLLEVRNLYEEADSEPPPEIRALLDAAPPAPLGCRIPAVGPLPGE